MAASIRRLVAFVGIAMFGLFATAAQAETDGQRRQMERARIALDAFLDDPNFEDVRVYVQNAYGVLIVPELLKAGFFFGGQHGIGILMVRDPQTGDWGQPAFYSVYGGSFGLQFGGASSDVVITLMNEGAVERLTEHHVKFGADAGLAVGRVGASAGVGTTTHFGEDVYVFSKSKGLFGGFAIDGTVVVAKDDWNTAYYGHEVDATTIVRTPGATGTEVAALHDSLMRF